MSRIIRRSPRKMLIDLKGEVKTVREWSEHTGIPVRTIRDRAKRGLHPTAILPTWEWVKMEDCF